MTLNFQTTKNFGVQGFNQFIGIINAAQVKTGFMGLGRRQLNWEDSMGAKLNLIFAAGCDLNCILTARIENAQTQTEETFFTEKNAQLEEMLEAIALVASNVLNDYSDFEYDAFTEATTSFLTNELELDSSSYDYTQVLSRVALEVARDTVAGTLKSSGFGDAAKVITAITQFFADTISEICELDGATTTETVNTAPAASSLQSIFDSL